MKFKDTKITVLILISTVILALAFLDNGSTKNKLAKMMLIQFVKK